MDYSLPIFNKTIQSKLLEERLTREIDGKEELFRIVCDLTLGGSYGESVVSFLDGEVIGIDETGVTVSVNIGDIERLYIKRMYGNAVFMADKKTAAKK